MCIDRLYRAHDAGEEIDGVARVVYVSPLKALAVDIAENLERPLAEIAVVAAELGLAARRTSGWRCAPATPPSSQRTRWCASRRASWSPPPSRSTCSSPARRGRDALRTVETVIVDEIHAVARDKRGAHLALTLERLEALCEQRPSRIGLSATQRPIETVGRLLVGDRPLPVIVDAGHQRTLDLALELPEGELEAVTSAEQMGDVARPHRRAGRGAPHHAGVRQHPPPGRAARAPARRAPRRRRRGRAPRHRCRRNGATGVETRLRAGDLRALVATASLELGIDIGPVELVCQIGSPRSIATFLQRVGRSNHSRAGTPKGRLYPLTRDELVECTALLAAVHAGRLDAIQLPQLPARHRRPADRRRGRARRSGAPTTSSRWSAAPRRTTT